MFNVIIAVLLILFAAFSRLIPHPMNFAPVTAIALFAGVYLDKKYAFIVPLAAYILSDIFLGFYSGIEWVYGAMMLIALVGLWLKKRLEDKKLGTKAGYILGTTLASSIIFFIVSNFGVWFGGYYGITFNGLVECYIAAIPFFRNAVAGDLFYVAAMFGIYELVKRFSGENVLAESKVRK
jgi:hypothetical protein